MLLGILLGVSPQHLILRAQDWDDVKSLPEIGETVFDTQKSPIGKIADIFGPVKKPFISIAIRKSGGLTLEQYQDKKGQSYYTLPPKKSSGNERKKSRDFSKGGKSRTGNPGLRTNKPPQSHSSNQYSSKKLKN
jgi:rRNA processing protein Gar1